MLYHLKPFVLMSLVGLLCLRTGSAEETAKPAEEPASFDISGVIESTLAVQVKLNAEEITGAELRRVLPHGSEVKKGQAIAWFKTKEVDQRIAKEEPDLRLAEIAMEAAEFAFEQFEATQKLDREAAVRRRKTARQAYDNFVDVDRDAAIVGSEFSLKSARESLENVQEELEQLQKMYAEDELTEESEEIVLKRAQSAVESAEYRLSLAERRHQRTLAQEIPAQTASQEETLARAELAFAASMRELEDARAKKIIERNRQRSDLEKQRAKFDTLRAERQALTIQAPFDGLLYHGELTRGRMSDKPSTLAAGSKVTPETVIYTIVSPDRLQIRADLNEEQFANLKVGQTGRVLMKALPHLSAQAAVRSLSPIPFANNKFNCVLSLKRPKKLAEEKIVPGFSCTVMFETVTDPSSQDEQDE